MASQDTMMKKMDAKIDKFAQSSQASIHNLEVQVGQLAKLVVEKDREALANMPSYAKYIKEIVSNKKKLEEFATVHLNEECASINLMPLTLFKKLEIAEMKPTTISLQLADRSVKYPLGVVEDILVKVGKFYFPADFLILDMGSDTDTSLILDSTTFKIREVSKLLGSSSAPVSETSHSASPSPTDHSPARETRKSKYKGVPDRVAVVIGDDNLDTIQPEKRRRSAKSVKVESDPPVQQVFKTLRSSVKNKAPATVSTTSTRKMKPTTRSRGRSVTPDVQATSDNPDTTIYKPQFVSATTQGKWSTMVRRELIVQRSVDENQLNSVCDILPLLSEVVLMKTVTSIFPYSKLLTYEFYCNLNEEIDNLTGTRCMQIFIRGKWYVFGPDMINEYYGLKAVDEEEITGWDLVARTLTGGQTPIWPTGDIDNLSSSKLTSKYVILHRIALHNWLPSAHFHTVSKQLAALLFRIGTKMSIDLGKWIFYHFLTLIHPREQKVRLPYPNLIFGVLTTHGLVPMPSEIISPTLLYIVDPCLLNDKHILDVTPVNALPSSDADTPVDDSPHAKDVQLFLRLKARVSELETVNGIIVKQLNAARTELATVLLRLSLTEFAAAENVKSDSEGPSNA
ncbi:PREDICTED: uncharacterized protein LOC109183930 [Ipomoea nil]|uniref:uncharacterized protein LOC109183930 n=1 Tax=Ipomoea nil TaxID=35883 RepID=UPI0009016108|nr:PREDICTED: uncharacterized protein LOC109183930 [Ipomoea nil]